MSQSCVALPDTRTDNGSKLTTMRTDNGSKLTTMRYFVVFSVLGTFLGVFSFRVVNPGPSFPPTKGEVWPKPQVENKQAIYYKLVPSAITVNVTAETCPILTSAVERFLLRLKIPYRIIRQYRRRGRRLKRLSTVLMEDEHFLGNLRDVEVSLAQPCEDYPYFEMDESYELSVSESSKLRSDSIWGILRGLETLLQLFYLSDDYDVVLINATQIEDYPRYPHRGLLLDTSRHYVSMKNILLTLDAMAMNKMNVFHWHIVDDQSFPYVSVKFPNLSKFGAYFPTMVYSQEAVREVVEYARDRGIRVIPEFDVPGHTRSWGVAYPNVLTECFQGNKVVGLGPMNPLRDVTYKLLRDLFQEVQTVFPDSYLHIGGDEVNLECWKSNPEIVAYLKKNNMTVQQLHGLFMSNVIPLLAQNTTPVVWQEVFDERVPLDNHTLVHLWKGSNNALWENEIINIVRGGNRVLFSAAWYLDHLDIDWAKMYSVDPRLIVNDQRIAEHIMGGEACMWGEMMDDRNVISRVWPRTSAVAEVLWSAPRSTYSYFNQRGQSLDTPGKAYNRIEEHTCRMIRHGIDAQPPSGPGFCVA